jgi:branched-subunit amino acid transport protein
MRRAAVNYNVWVLILGMALVTYIPRMAPMVMIDAERLPKHLVRMLKNIPYAALGALIFPGILTVDQNIWFGIVGGVIAGLIALSGAHLVVVVIGTVLSLTSLLKIGVF